MSKEKICKTCKYLQLNPILSTDVCGECRQNYEDRWTPIKKENVYCYSCLKTTEKLFKIIYLWNEKKVKGGYVLGVNKN